MFAFDALAAKRELVARRLPFEVRKERVVTHGSGEGAFGEAEDDHEIEVESDAHGDRPDEDAVAEPPDTPEVGFELERKRAREDVEIDGPFDLVEGREPVEGGLDAVGSLAFGLGPAFAAGDAAERFDESLACPFRAFTPRARTRPLGGRVHE